MVSLFSNPSDGKFTKKKFRVSQPWSGGPGGLTRGWTKVKFFPAHFDNHMTPKHGTKVPVAKSEKTLKYFLSPCQLDRLLEK